MIQPAAAAFSPYHDPSLARTTASEVGFLTVIQCGARLARYGRSAVRAQDGTVIIHDPIIGRYFSRVLSPNSPWVLTCGAGGISVILGASVSGHEGSVSNDIEIDLASNTIDDKECAVLGPRLVSVSAQFSRKPRLSGVRVQALVSACMGAEVSAMSAREAATKAVQEADRAEAHTRSRHEQRATVRLMDSMQFAATTCVMRVGMLRLLRHGTNQKRSATILLPNCQRLAGTRRQGLLLVCAKDPINRRFSGRHVTGTDGRKRITKPLLYR